MVSLIIELLVVFSIKPAAYAADDIQFEPSGSIKFSTTSTGATTSIRYKTVGFTIARNARCTSTNCAPQQGGPHGVVRITQVGEVHNTNGTVTTYFNIPVNQVNDALEAAGLEKITNGGQIWLSSIFHVINGSRPNTDFVTLQSIKNAESWADPSKFRQYYDIPVKVNGYYPVTKIYRTSEGIEMYSAKVESDIEDVDKNWPVGKPVDTVMLDKTYPFQGDTYKLVKSYVQSKRKLNEQNFVQTGDPERNAKLSERNFTNYLGGTNVVGVYRKVTTVIPDDPIPDGKAACKPNINPPNEIASPQVEYMDPGAQGHILADDPTNDIHFDATLGIPTSEHLYANTWAMNYLFQHTFGKQKGTITYDCTADITYARTWKVKQPALPGPNGTTIPQPDTQGSDEYPHQYKFSFERNYSYWKINNVELYSIEQAEMENYALPDGGRITLWPQEYTAPDLEMEHDEEVEIHVIPQETGEISFVPDVVAGDGYEPPEVPDDTELLKGIAEGQTGPPDVKNDALDFTWEGSTTKVMDGSTVVENGPDPAQIPAPTKIGSYKNTGEQVLYADQLLIPQDRLNRANTESTGEIEYALHPTTLGGSQGMTFPINSINMVTVHTPVVNYSLVSDDQPHNQKTVPNMSRSALILERPFTVRIPTSGQHLDAGSYPGYGDRDYAKYYRIKQVRFPFDVYSADRTQFYPRNTWIDVQVPVLDTTFYLPVWVDEGDYQVEFRNIAENAPSNFSTQPKIDAQPDANTDLYYHAASDEVSVEVIGRLYDFEITDIADYNWELVFRRFKNSLAPTWISYWTGTQDIDGDKRGNKPQFTVPIRPGSHPLQGYQNVAVKTGYHFKFDFKTKGNMFGPRDGIRLTPTFDFVSKDGSTRVPVDLYYSTNQRNFIRIGSTEDQVKRFVILNDRLRQVPSEQLRDTATYKYNRYGEIHPGMMSERAYQEYYRDKFTKMKTPVGGYSLLLIPEQLRTFIGPKTNIPTTASADVLRANAAIQQWYGEYSLPAEPYVVQAGTNLAEYGRTHGGLDAKSPIFLKDGYVVVNFNFESIREGNLAAPHLQYIHAPLMNQWLLEGFQREVEDSYGNSFTLRDGDVVFYHADRSSRDDFSAQVPH
ncbi:DUF5704 domain-containing protein [Paenibacillus sp. FSL M8-0212]|uniref:DUF5704 domain-containing protein n=1 Tax=Paenibacillus sp. FSL M8-0212 TaxID=2921618 RepID=UPI0030F9433D